MKVRGMSAIGTKRTWASALQMSAFGGSGHNFRIAECPLMTQSGHWVDQRLTRFVFHFSLAAWSQSARLYPLDVACSQGAHAAARVHHVARLHIGVAICGACAAAREDAADRLADAARGK